MSFVLELEDVGVSYRRPGMAGRLARSSRQVDVLQDVNLQLPDRKTLVLVGESGSGKTTLARSIVGLTPVSRGSILVDGLRIPQKSEVVWRRVRRDIGLMFQDPAAALNPRMTVAQAIGEPFAIHGVEGDRLEIAAALLDRVGLSGGFLGRYPHQLSGGQARRVAIARALALKPKLVIADEPTAGLDLTIQGDVLNLLRELQAEMGISYLIITHNLSVARHMADQVAVLYRGRVVEAGPTATIFGAPAHPYTRVLLAARQHGDTGLRSEPAQEASNRGCTFALRCPFARAMCETGIPETIALDRDHRAACHFPLDAPPVSSFSTGSVVAPPSQPVTGTAK